MLRLKNFTLLIFNYQFFQVVTCWLDIVLSPFLQTIGILFRDFCTNACYLFTNSFCQLRDSLGIIFLYFFI